MGSHINEEELEELARSMDRDVLIKTIKVGVTLTLSGFIFYSIFY